MDQENDDVCKACYFFKELKLKRMSNISAYKANWLYFIVEF